MNDAPPPLRSPDVDLIRKMRVLLTPREQWQAGALLMLMMVGAGLEVLGVGAIPVFVALLADPEALAGYPVAAAAIERLGLDTPQRLILFGALTLLVLFVVKNAFLTAQLWIQSRWIHNRQAALARRLLWRYLHSPYSFHLQRNTAELLRNTNHSAMDAVASALFPMMILAMEGLTVLAVLLLLLWVEPLASLAAFAVLGGTTLLFLRVVRRNALHYGKEAHEARLRMLQTVNEGIGGIKVTRVLGRERAFFNAFSVAADAAARAGKMRQVLAETPRLFLETAGVVGLLGVAGLLVLQGRPVEALIPTLTLLAVAVVRMIPSFNRIATAQNNLRAGVYAVDAVYGDLLTPLAPEDDAEAPAPFAESIVLDRVTFQYPGAAEPSLREVSVEIPAGKVVGFIGPTGSGKTTLVDLVMGLLEPTEGRVLVDGRDLRGRARAWQRQIGYVPQDIYLTDDTLRRNVAFGLADEDIDDEAVWRAVEAAQVRGFIERLPAGIQTVVGERGVRLSGGQRQRIGIARALYHQPEVLVLDEATSALDNETEAAVMDAVEHLRGSRTILIIAHRLTTVEGCDQIVRLEDGRLLASGSYDRRAYAT